MGDPGDYRRLPSSLQSGLSRRPDRRSVCRATCSLPSSLMPKPEPGARRPVPGALCPSPTPGATPDRTRSHRPNPDPSPPMRRVRSAPTPMRSPTAASEQRSGVRIGHETGLRAIAKPSITASPAVWLCGWPPSAIRESGRDEIRSIRIVFSVLTVHLSEDLRIPEFLPSDSNEWRIDCKF